MNQKIDISNRLSNILVDILNKESVILTREMTAQDIDGWDSLSHISIVVAIENEFGIKFKLVELKKLKNIGDFIDLIYSKLN